MRASAGIRRPQAARVAAAVQALVVGAHDLGDRARRRRCPAAARRRCPGGGGHRASRGPGARRRAPSPGRRGRTCRCRAGGPAVCAYSWSRLDSPTVIGDVARERGDRRTMARRTRVALVEGPDEARQDAPGQARVLARAFACGDDEPRHVRERDDVQQDEDESDEAELGVDLGDRRDDRDVDRDRRDQTPVIDRRPAVSDVPSRIANSSGAIRKLSAMVTAAAAASNNVEARRRRGPWIDGLEPRRPSRGDGRRGARDVDDQRAPSVTLDQPGRDERDGGDEEGRQGAPGSPPRSWPRRTRRRPLSWAEYWAASSSAMTALNVKTAAKRLDDGWVAGDKVTAHHPNTHDSARDQGGECGPWATLGVRHERGRYSVVSPWA